MLLYRCCGERKCWFDLQEHQTHPVIFLVVGLAFDGLINFLKSKKFSTVGNRFAWFIGLFLVVWSGWFNYFLVFDQFADQFNKNAWNTSELGAVIKQFSDTTGYMDSAWVVPYPHWVDTRLVGIRAGFPLKDYALWPESIGETTSDERPKLYLIKPNDSDTVDLLRNLYPDGVLRLYKSRVEGKDFYRFSVFPSE